VSSHAAQMLHFRLVLAFDDAAAEFTGGDEEAMPAVGGQECRPTFIGVG